MLGRRIPFNQVAFATVIGVAGGVYIYRPYFEGQRPRGTPKEPTPPPPHVEEQPQPPPPREDNVPTSQSSPEETKS